MDSESYDIHLANDLWEIKEKLSIFLREALDVIERLGRLDLCGSEVLRWREEHDAKELERIKREMLARLTPKEKRALGLVG